MLDVMRFFAAIGVIFVHVSFVARPSPDMGEFLRFLMRWAVPFFFLLTGYFLRSESGLPVVTTDRLRKLIVILIAANVIYIPVLIAFDGITAMDVKIILSGAWFHLWFLSSLVVGLLTFLLIPKLEISRKYITVVSVTFILLAHIFDIVSSFDPKYIPIARFCRFLMAGPLMWVGFLLVDWRRWRPNSSGALVLLASGVLVCFAETLFYSKIQTSIFDRQYSLGSLAIAVGAILWASETQRQAWDPLVKIGRDCSLMIYIIHPIFLKVTAILVGLLGVTASLPYWQVLIGGVFSICAALLIDRYLPVVANLLRGEMPSLRKDFHAR
ncbi:acyltransferase [Rhizobium sp. XQZ8]|uniref:acyltransferase n=1 Tax=Rhizobium populisoli TaxID=2859785 RepID=UPI001C66D506|nr:acyltransferase [Rhizobium populisoli]MBW6420395.1 acyltransferase [Rhizobium populisoli]